MTEQDLTPKLNAKWGIALGNAYIYIAQLEVEKSQFICQIDGLTEKEAELIDHIKTLKAAAAEFEAEKAARLSPAAAAIAAQGSEAAAAGGLGGDKEKAAPE